MQEGNFLTRMSFTPVAHGIGNSSPIDLLILLLLLLTLLEVVLSSTLLPLQITVDVTGVTFLPENDPRKASSSPIRSPNGQEDRIPMAVFAHFHCINHHRRIFRS